MNPSLGNVLMCFSWKLKLPSNQTFAGSQPFFFLEKNIQESSRHRKNASKPPQSAVESHDFRLLMLSRNDYLTAYSRLSVTRGKHSTWPMGLGSDGLVLVGAWVLDFGSLAVIPCECSDPQTPPEGKGL